MTSAVRPIFLIGFMACGKSTLLGALAGRVRGRAFVDLDTEVERRAGRTIAEIFATEGEAAFRRLESEVLEELCHTDAIVACGGGTPCRAGAMEAMKATGEVVWLRADTDITLRRLAEAPGKRPLVDALIDRPEELRRHVERMMAEREPYYSQAHSTFDSSQLDTGAEIEATASRFIDIYQL